MPTITRKNLDKLMEVHKWAKCGECHHELRWTLKDGHVCGEGAGMFGLARVCQCKSHPEQYKRWSLT